MKLNKIALFIFVTFLMLFAVACGGDSDTVSSGGDTSEAAPATDVPAAPAGDAAKGAELYSSTCIACHGQDGVGIEGLGKGIPDSEFIRGASDEELLAFIKVGRSTSDPENTTGVDMPPKGGNPALSDSDVLDIIAYFRTLQ
jgi:mono/diheme cytochrome c family protein